MPRPRKTPEQVSASRRAAALKRWRGITIRERAKQMAAAASQRWSQLSPEERSAATQAARTARWQREPIPNFPSVLDNRTRGE